LVRYEDLPGDYYYLDDDNFRVIGQDTGRIIQLGDEVRIRVKAVDLFKHKMDFEMLADTPMKMKKSKQKRRLY
jgi:ribonuclease R